MVQSSVATATVSPMGLKDRSGMVAAGYHQDAGTPLLDTYTAPYGALRAF
jgi:hypothetical protein